MKQILNWRAKLKPIHCWMETSLHSQNLKVKVKHSVKVMRSPTGSQSLKVKVKDSLMNSVTATDSLNWKATMMHLGSSLDFLKNSAI
jgi:hypothetical protein